MYRYYYMEVLHDIIIFINKLKNTVKHCQQCLNANLYPISTSSPTHPLGYSPLYLINWAVSLRSKVLPRQFLTLTSNAFLIWTGSHFNPSKSSFIQPVDGAWRFILGARARSFALIYTHLRPFCALSANFNMKCCGYLRSDAHDRTKRNWPQNMY